MAEAWLIKNAELVNEGRRRQADLRIRDGRIDAIGGDLDARADEQVLDAAGLWLLPGIIDDHVHFREPGMTHKADIAHESRACVAGGVTSFMEMPNTNPPATRIDALEAKYDRAADTSLANYAFHFGAANDNLDEVRKLDPKRIPGLKIFMCASTGNMCVDDDDTLEILFRESPVTVLTHCEDPAIIKANMTAALKRHGNAIPVSEHPLIRSREACVKSTRKAIALARRHDTQLHVLHVSTADEAAMFEPGPIDGKRITAETCVHFLHFDADDYERLGCRIKCNPSIKDPSDREALIQALAEGRIDVLATDHAPHLAAEKDRAYAQSPSGLPLVQFSLQSALERVADGKLTLERLVEVTSHAPAKRFNVSRRGFLREGYAADLVLVDPRRPHAVRADEVLSKCAWSPFEGETFRHHIAATFVNGTRAWDGERICTGQLGQRLAFDR